MFYIISNDIIVIQMISHLHYCHYTLAGSDRCIWDSKKLNTGITLVIIPKRNKRQIVGVMYRKMSIQT